MASYRRGWSPMTCGPMGLQPAILGLRIVTNGDDGATIERRTRISRPDEGGQDAGVQEPGFSPAISFRPCRHLQHLQRSTPSHFSEDAPSFPSLGDGYVARGR